jgi:nitrite reductase (NADH) small subunit
MTAIQHLSADNDAAVNASPQVQSDGWSYVCEFSDLVVNSGVCALIDEKQVAIFNVKMNGTSSLFAVSNFDPIGKANVMYRGLVGSIGGVPVVASPLYKEHYSLETGECTEHPDIHLTSFAIKQDGERIYIRSV